MKKFLILCAFVWVAALPACDDGPVYEDAAAASPDGITLRLTGNLQGIDSWSGEYSVVAAGFGESDYAVISRKITPDPDGEVSLVLTGIGSEVKRLELCVINRLRKRIVSFASVDCSAASERVDMEVGTLDVSMFRAIQQNIFDAYCIQCHGGSAMAGAGLHLTEGRSYEALVNVPSTKSPDGAPLVQPFDVANSFLHTTLNTDISLTQNWRMDHVDMVQFPDLLALLDDWIAAGAGK